MGRYEVQIKIKETSMNAYAGWVTVHATVSRSEAQRSLRDLIVYNHVDEVRVVSA